MNTLAKWNPLRDLEDMQHRLSSLFNRRALKDFGEETMVLAEWTPLVDVTEDHKEYLIKAELPEVDKNDVKVTVENGTLMIAGERKLEKEEHGKKYCRVERAHGSFLRAFTMPEGTSGTGVTAEFKDGVLKVHLPKSEEVRTRSIDVAVS